MQIFYSDLSFGGVTDRTRQQLSFQQWKTLYLDTYCPFCLTAGATGQGFVARLPTGRDGIRAALSFGVAQFKEFGEWRLTTGTGLHQGRGAWARLAGAAMAHLLAPVGLTAQHPAQRKSHKVGCEWN